MSPECSLNELLVNPLTTIQRDPLGGVVYTVNFPSVITTDLMISTAPSLYESVAAFVSKFFSVVSMVSKDRLRCT